MNNEIKFIKYLIDILREIDLEKNSIEDIREVLNFVAGKLEKYINVNEDLQKENKHLKDLYNQALKDYDELLKEQ